ncbi:MAG TPA: FkbM family methyltransferase [Candidatus Paceibacterota bacterium]|nr:FkbM family methyltransferase [Verrucomicrobiota bacterium]HSA12061.1 FkbM family methyltransferase [Candidatus Paceibacterota bacterium]
MKHLSECECLRIIEQLKKLPAPVFYGGSGVKQALAWRRLALKLAWRKVISFADVLRPAFLSPTTKNPAMIRIRDTVCNGYVTGWIEKSVAGEYDGVEIFGKLASPPASNGKSWEDFLALYDQVVLQDQYSARELLKPDSVVIDGGANVGLFTLLASHLTPKGRVYAFEPAKLTSTALKQNTKDCKNVEVFALGLGDRVRKAEMMVHEACLSGSTLSDSGMTVHGAEKGDLVPEEVSITTIDEFAQGHKLEKLDFIKVDAEGYEKQILRGAADTIRRFRPILAVSAYHFPNDRTDIVSLVGSITPGYRHTFSSRAEEDLIFLPQPAS